MTRASRVLSHMDRRTWFVAAVGLFIAFLVFFPTSWLLYASFLSSSPFEAGDLTWKNYLHAYSDGQVKATIVNTAVFAIGQTVVAVAFGSTLGWIVSRTNTPGRHLFEFLLLLVFLFPMILGVLAWSMLLSPGKGMINQLLVALFDLETAPFDIYSMAGMIFVQGMYVTPLAFLMITPAFASVDASLEESARMSGSGHAGTFFRVTLPLVLPAVLSTAVLLSIVGIESFDIPQLLGAPVGIYTYPSLIYTSIAVRNPPEYGTATALAASLLCISVFLVFLFRWATRKSYRFETVRGKSYRAGIVDLGRWKWLAAAFCWIFFFLAIILPIAVIVFGSFLRFFGRFNRNTFDRMTFQNYVDIFNHPNVVAGFFNSVLLATVGGILCVLLSFIVAYIAVKTRIRGRGALEAVAMLPIAFPSTVLALGLLWAYVHVPLPIYGTLLILGIAYLTRYVSVGLRTVSGGIIQLSGEFEEASRMAGASWPQTIRRIVVPLLKPTLAAAWLILFLIFVRELGMSVLLVGIGNPVISVVMFEYFSNAELGALSALAVIVFLLVVTLVLIARLVFGVRIAQIEGSQ